MTHGSVWSAIDALAARHGTTPSGLAKRAGLDATTFNPSKRTSAAGRPRWPSLETVAAICAVTGTTLTSFASMVESLPTTTGKEVIA